MVDSTGTSLTLIEMHEIAPITAGGLGRERKWRKLRTERRGTGEDVGNEPSCISVCWTLEYINNSEKQAFSLLQTCVQLSSVSARNTVSDNVWSSSTITMATKIIPV